MKREHIIEKTLELIQQREGAHDVNMREIARELGCAHTNLYNYFEDYGSLLWAALDEAAQRMLDYVGGEERSEEVVLSLQDFFGRYIDFFLLHKGWFRLMWAEPLPMPRPEKSASAGILLRDQFIFLLQHILSVQEGTQLTYEEVFAVLHTLHCYIYGEVMIYISQRGLIREENEFRSYVLSESLAMLPLLLARINRAAF